MDTNLSIDAGPKDDADAVASCEALDAKFQEMGKKNYEFNYYPAGHMLSAFIWTVSEEKCPEEVLTGNSMEDEVPTGTVHNVTQSPAGVLNQKL